MTKTPSVRRLPRGGASRRGPLTAASLLLLTSLAFAAPRGAGADVPPPATEPLLEDVLTGTVGLEADPGAKGFGRFKKPFAVSFDDEGRVLVTDWGRKAVVRFDRRRGAAEILGGAGAAGLERPLGLAVAPGAIYVADGGLRRVLALDPQGNRLAAFGGPETLVNPTDAAVSPDGARLFVADSGDHRIVVFDRASGEVVASFGGEGGEPGRFRFPSALVFDRGGRLLVSESGNARLQILSPAGESLEVWTGPRGGRNFGRPADLALDEAGRIYVADSELDRVWILAPDATLLALVGREGRQPGSFDGVSGVSVRAGEIAVVDRYGGRLQIFRQPDAESAPTTAVAGQPDVPATAEPSGQGPPGVAASPAGEVTAEELPEPSGRPVTPETGERSATAMGGREGSETDRVLATVQAWAGAWQAQDVDAYLSYYSRDFWPSDGSSRADWEAQRRQRLSAPRFIEVGLAAVRARLEVEGRALVLFEQSYRSDVYADRVRKHLELRLEDGEWRIVVEQAEPIP